MKKKATSVVGILLVFSGAILGALFFGAATWADYEALFFEGTWKADENLVSYNCPALIGRDEVSAVTVNIKNTADRVIKPAVRTRISEGFISLVRQDHVALEIAPGELEVLSYPISGEDAAYDRVVFVRIYRFAGYPYAAQYAACGILVADLGAMTGQQAVASIVGGSLGSMLLGIGLFFVGNRPALKDRTSHKMRALLLMAAFVTVGLVTVWQNMMFLGVMAFFIAGLMILVVFLNFLTQK